MYDPWTTGVKSCLVGGLLLRGCDKVSLPLSICFLIYKLGIIPAAPTTQGSYETHIWASLQHMLSSGRKYMASCIFPSDTAYEAHQGS